MDHTEADYAQAITEAFPNKVLRSLLLGVVDGYKATPTVCKKSMDAPDRHDVLGHIRRGKVNEQLRGVADLYKLNYTDQPNSNGSAYFLSIFSGTFRLVAHLVGRSRDMVRPAKIRKEWARHNRDGRWRELFPTTKPPIPADARYVAFLIHGPRGRHRDQPAFVDIVIPDENFNKYIHRVNLFQMFPQVARDMLMAEQERKEPTPRRQRRKKDNLS